MKPIIRNTLLCLWSFCFTHPALAQDEVMGRDAAQVVKEYQKARKEGLTKLNKGLIEKLEVLKKRQMQAANLNGANAIQGEIDKLQSEIASFDSNPQVAEAKLEKQDASKLTAVLSNTLWKGPHDEWFFRPDGTGSKVFKEAVHATTWEVLPDGTVRATGGGSDVIFEFRSKKSADRWTYGETKPNKSQMSLVPNGADPAVKK